MKSLRIDGHVHISNAIIKDGTLDNNRIRKYIEKYRDLGIEKVVLIEGPDIVLKLMDICGDFIIPVFRIDCDNTRIKQIESYFKQGCKGIKFIAPQHPYSDARYFPLYECIASYGGVAVFHTGYLTHDNYRIYTNINILDMKPAHLDAIARRFPELKILMAHYGNPWWEEAWKVSYSHPNIYTDLSGGTAYLRSRFLWKELFAPDGKLFLPSFEKLCFASDLIYFGDILEIEPYFEFYDSLFEVVGASKELIEKVNHGNIEKLFSL